MKKLLSWAYLVAFILLFLAPTIIFEIFGSYIDSVNYEQRNAAEKPVFSLQTIEEYPQQFEQYYNDNLPFRSQLIELNSLTDYYLFRQSPVDKVILSKDGWLFYNPQKNYDDPIADYQGSNLYSEKYLQRIAENLTAAKEQLEAQGKKFIVFIAPNKHSIYGNDYLPFPYNNGNTYSTGDQVADYLHQHTDLTVIWPKSQLLSAIKNDPLRDYYYKTDTHWNALGSYIGAAELLKALNISMPGLDEVQIQRQDGFAGGLITMMGLSKFLTYDHSYTLSGYSDQTASGPVYPIEGKTRLVQYLSENENSQSLFIIRDSFTTAMVPYLSSQFNTSSYIHRDYFTPDMLSEYPSDIVVVQVVERYLSYLAAFSPI